MQSLSIVECSCLLTAYQALRAASGLAICHRYRRLSNVRQSEPTCLRIGCKMGPLVSGCGPVRLNKSALVDGVTTPHDMAKRLRSLSHVRSPTRRSPSPQSPLYRLWLVQPRLTRVSVGTRESEAGHRDDVVVVRLGNLRDLILLR
jgi:hypothetical protein